MHPDSTADFGDLALFLVKSVASPRVLVYCAPFLRARSPELPIFATAQDTDLPGLLISVASHCVDSQGILLSAANLAASFSNHQRSFASLSARFSNQLPPNTFLNARLPELLFYPSRFLVTKLKHKSSHLNCD